MSSNKEILLFLANKAQSLKTELVQIVSDSKIIYKDDPPGVVGWWGKYKIIPNDQVRKQQYMVSFEVWIDEVKKVCGNTKEYQNLWSLRNSLQDTWNMHTGDVNDFITKSQDVFDSLICLLNEKSKYC